MSLELDPNSIWRDFVTDGIPASGRHEPRKVDIRSWSFSMWQAVIALLADADPGLALPNLLIRYTVTGGTANAIVAEPNLTPPVGVGLALFSMAIAQANTGNVTINGKPLLTNGGEQIAAGEILPGDLLVFLDNGTHFRLIMDTGSLRNKLAAEAAQAIAEQAAIDALAIAGSYEDLQEAVDLAETHAQEAGNQVASVIPSVQRFAVGAAVQSVDLGNVELHPASVRVFIDGVYQFGNTWDLTDGVLTPVGDTWPGDGIVENMEVVIDATSAIAFMVPSNGSVTTQKLADGAVTIDKLGPDLLQDLEGLAASELITNAVGPVPTYVPGASATRTLITGETFNGGDPKYHRHFGGIVRDRQGRVHIIYRRATEHGVGVPGVICQIILGNEGRGVPSSPSERVIVPAIAGRDQRDCNIGITPEGDLVITYADVSQTPDGSGPTYFKTIYSEDDGEDWSEPSVFRTFDIDFTRPYGSIKVVPSDDPAYKWRLEQPAYYQIGDTTSYVCALFYSYDGRTWTEGTPIFSGVGGYNETEVAWLNQQVGFAASRGGGLAWWVTTDGGANWSGPNVIPAASVTNAVAPSLNIVFSDGTPYCLLGWCDRSTDETKWAAARCEDVMANGNAFSSRVTVTSSNDMVNASGYQRPLIYPNGRMLFVEFKEYLTGTPWSDVRLVQANVSALLPRQVADMRFGGSSSGLVDPAPLKVITKGVGEAGGVGYAATASSRPIWHFENPNGPVGGISTSASATSFNTTSDGQLKINREALTVELDIGAIIDGLEPVAYDWLDTQGNPTGERGYGLIAQDVHRIVPSAVTEGNGAPGDRDYRPWGMDNSKLFVFLLAELKSVRVRLNALEGGE